MKPRRWEIDGKRSQVVDKPEVAVGGADEVQRHRELEEETVDEHEVTDRHRSRDDLVACHQHDQRQASAEDGVLTHVKEGKGGLRLKRGLLVALEALVVLLLLMGLVPEVLYLWCGARYCT